MSIAVGSDLLVDVDLCLRVDLDEDHAVLGQLTAVGQDLELRLDHPELLASGADAAGIREAAATLAGLGVRLHVVSMEGIPLVSLGAVRSSWWQRRVTRSRHMRVASLRGSLTAARGRARRRTPVLPASGGGVPTTPWPPLPTFQRRPRRPLTTTHQQGGSPRLTVVAAPQLPGAHTVGPRHWLTDTTLVVGSDPGCDLVLPGLAPRHAEVRHTPDDEYAVRALPAPGGGTHEVRVHGELVADRVLRTSARLELGGWTLVYARDEHADHGRPFAGRIGGELGHQRRQAPRPTAPEDGSPPLPPAA
jgi:hypothetical protein